MAVSLITSRRRQLKTVVDLVIAGSSWRFHQELCRLELSSLPSGRLIWQVTEGPVELISKIPSAAARVQLSGAP
jgi:hypothetical protein